MPEAQKAVVRGDSDDDDNDPLTQEAVCLKKKKRKPKKKDSATCEQGATGDEANDAPAEIAEFEPAVEAEAEPDTKAANESEEDAEEEVEDAQAVAKKKKKKKKRKGVSSTEVPRQILADSVAEAAGADVTARAVTEGDADDVGQDSDDAEVAVDLPPQEYVAAGPKKKRKSKKKAHVSEEAGPPAAEEAVEESEGEADEGNTEESAEDGAEAAKDASQTKKKKKRKPKKKGAGAKGVAEGIMAIPDEEFVQWVQSALVTTSNGTDQMSKEELLRPPKSFWGYKYTGNLRPAFVTQQMKMPAGWCMPDYATEPEGISHSERQGPKEVPVLEGKDLDTMREACRLGREVLDIAARFMRAGVTGDQIDRIVWQACVDRKIYPSPLNYYRFPKSVCVSPNEVICHGIPDCRAIEEGDIVNLDVSIYHQGYHADLNETYFIGECDEDAHRLVRTAYSALHAAASMIRPGTFYRDLGNAIHAEATKNSCAVVTTYCGHGVGQLFHGPPKVPHYRKNKAVGIMKPGHVFTVEPMINLGSNGGDRTWPDNWTAVTKDGKRSAQFEHTFLVTEQGVEVLTCRQKTDRSAMPLYDVAMFQL